MSDQQMDRRVERKTKLLFLNATSILVLFILYASLLPFNLVSASHDVSLSSFLNILMYADEGTGQGQWIGHAIFTALLAFTSCGYCILSGSKNRWFLAFVLIVIFGVVIEYFQMFIGSRGTSLVDIYANLAGMIIGYMLWLFFGKFSLSAIRYYYRHATLPVKFVRKIYLIFVVAIVLFPFDFYLNSLQLDVAFATKGYPLFEKNMSRGIGPISLLAAMVLVFPLGVLYRLSEVRRKRHYFSFILKFGIFFLILEILQFFEVSGQSSLLSFLFKFIGLCIGYYSGRYLNTRTLLEILLKIRWVVFLTLLVFVWLVLKIKGFSIEGNMSLSNIMTIIDQASFFPFIYYIDVNSGEALLSFLLNFVIFIPIGGYFAIHQISKGGERAYSFNHLMVAGFLLALIFEALVLCWGGKRPDVTNIFVSGFALPMGYYIMMMIKKAVHATTRTNEKV